jgi:hypothetical protein
MRGELMVKTAQRASPHLGIFWLVEMSGGEARLLVSGCPVDQAEPYGDCLTYDPGHCDIWESWRHDSNTDPALRTIVQLYEYEDWPRGRIVFDQERDLFILYADRKIMARKIIERIQAEFHLPADRTEVKGDIHYQSNETPGALCD